MSDDKVSFFNNETVIQSWNRGPVTKFFSAPASCTATATLHSMGEHLFVGHYGDTFLDPSCYPQGSHSSDFNDIGWDNYYYSPAACPNGWNAETFTESVPFLGKTTVSLGPETTAAICCPGDFTYDANGHLCTSSFTEGQVLKYAKPTNKGNEWVQPVSTTTMASSSVILGDGIQVWWQPSDQKALAAVTSPPATSASTTATSQGQSTKTNASDRPTPTGSPHAKDQDSGLSTGAKVAIGVVIPLVAIAGLAALLLFLRNRRKKQPNPYEADAGAPMQMDATSKYAYHDAPAPAPAPLAEMPAPYSQPAPPQELPVPQHDHPELATRR